MPPQFFGNGNCSSETKDTSADEQEEQSEQGETEGEQVGGCVGINADKLARMLAAAKTRSQVQAVIMNIQADLNECEAGGKIIWT